MSSYLIDGIGDEVTILISSAFVVIMLTIAWMSTRVTDPSYDQFMATRQQQREQRQSQPQEATPSPSQSSETHSENEEIEPESSSSSSASSSVSAANQNIDEQAAGGQPDDNGDLREGHMFIRLKFMDETVKVVQVKPQDTIGNIRRKSFPQSTADRYRLIYRGQVLRNNNQTLEEYNISNDDQPVIHCFLSPEVVERPNQPNSASQQIQQAVDELNMGHFFMPLFGSFIGFLWYICIFHTSLFNLPSVFGIIGLTCFYIVLLANQFF